MRIYYYKNNTYCSNFDDCDDFSVAITKQNGKTTVSITAKEDLKLEKAVDLLPIPTNHQDLYFFNGYQSWTDTKEFKLVDRLRNIKNSPHIISHLYSMAAYGDNHFYRYSIRKSHGYDLFYSKGKHES